jgi:hypothetical protein
LPIRKHEPLMAANGATANGCRAQELSRLLPLSPRDDGDRASFNLDAVKAKIDAARAAIAR